MRRALSSTEITLDAAMATVRMVLLFDFTDVRRGGRLVAVDPPALR